MQWQDTGIILSANKYGENSLVVRVFTPSRGLHAGLVRSSSKNRNIFQSGNIVEISWRARLEEHLGNFTCELKNSIAGFVLNDMDKLIGLQAACSMVEQTMAERDPHPELYISLENFLINLKQNSNTNWHTHYIQLELELLKQLGFGLDLSSCAATGTTENLIYVSPKSGRAVCEDAGRPYADRLLKLPKLSEDTSLQEIKDGLQLTSYFLNQCFFIPHQKKIPAVRERLEAKIYN